MEREDKSGTVEWGTRPLMQNVETLTLGLRSHGVFFFIKKKGEREWGR